MKLSFSTFIRGQFAKQPPVVKGDLAGKTVIVLGANTGLGFEASKHFARMNPGRLILACRSQSRGDAALDRLKSATGYGKAELWLIDLADFESVKKFADKFERDGGRLDIFVENAALSTRKYEATKDGWEASLQVSDLSTPLLAFLLLPAMMRTAERYSTLPRLVVVASEVHHFTSIEKKVLERPDILKTLGSSAYCTKNNMTSRYFLTKRKLLLKPNVQSYAHQQDSAVLNILFVRAFNERLPASTPLVINAVNPGLCKTDLLRETQGIAALIVGMILNIVAFTAEEGSRQLVFGALGNADRPNDLRGEYLSACRVFEVSDFILSADGVKAQDQLWDELVDILGQVDSRVPEIVEKYFSSSKQ
ncbi:hypothetical protein R3P38DRAFT_2774153 [Favolaschia claudopus]|uniref:Uncharacterized protein n=1 Tax=Favolaschia claudopus TaxID=2862362 RepID=A0AAW0BXN5_9AGAR